jgi:hypothetical protein
MTLTPSQIEVLARFDGWVKQKHNDGTQEWETWSKGFKVIPVDGIAKHLTSPGVLIEMRKKIQASTYKAMYYSEVLTYMNESAELILSGEYTLAAIKTSELIQKLEA